MGLFHSIHSIASDLHAIREAMEVQHKELATTPKSICGMTRILEPQIAKDFPEFSWKEFCPDAQRMITEQITKTGATHVLFHRTEISDYRKENGACIVTLQSALQYIPGAEEDSKRGRKLRGQPYQTRYNSELLYVQDASAYGQDSRASGTICPQCGAPVTSLGQKKCEYCGSALTVINRRVWTLNRIYEA